MSEPIKELLDTGVGEPSLTRVWKGIDEKRRRRRAPAWAFAAAGLAAALAAWLVVSDPATDAGTSGPLALVAGGDLGPALRSGDALRFIDGSTVSAEGRLEVLANSSSMITFALREGRADFSVTPGGERRWVIECEFATVEVVGTQFSLHRTPNELSVRVREGVVLVRSAWMDEGVRRLSAGESIRLRRPPEPSAPPSIEPAVEAPADTESPARRPPRPASNRRWRRLAEAGDFRGAFDALGADGVARQLRTARDPESLMQLADVARLSGHPEHAVQPLRQCIADHPNDPRAPLAAFTLGRVLLRVGTAAEAAQAFAAARRLGLPRRLEADAMLREADAWRNAGNVERASAVQALYDAAYGGGTVPR
ncbi:MAG: FecR family protein [Myxococcota bacterium]